MEYEWNALDYRIHMEFVAVQMEYVGIEMKPLATSTQATPPSPHNNTTSQHVCYI